MSEIGPYSSPRKAMSGVENQRVFRVFSLTSEGIAGEAVAAVPNRSAQTIVTQAGRKNEMATQHRPEDGRAPATSMPGLLVLGPHRDLIASNAEAVQILCYPEKPDKRRQLSAMVAEKIPMELLRAQPDARSVAEFTSGRRRYTCTVHSLDVPGRAKGCTAILLERVPSPEVTLYGICRKYNLTARERQAMGHLLRGLTSKEIAQQMGISPNTVKAFVRSAMTKMGVSTRAGLVGRIAEGAPAAVHAPRELARARGA